MHFLQVGKPHPTLAIPAPNACIFTASTAGLELLLTYKDLTPREIGAIRTGRAEFALAYEGSLIWFLHRFGPLPWSEAVFTQHLLPEENRQMPSRLKDEQRYLLNVILVDAKTGIIRGLRAITLTPELSWTLRDMYSRQAQTSSITPAEYERTTIAIQNKYTTEELLELAEDRS